MTELRFRFCETVLVDLPDGTYVGVIEATEPGENLRWPTEGTVYHVRLPGHDGRSSQVVIVQEEALEKLAEM